MNVPAIQAVATSTRPSQCVSGRADLPRGKRIRELGHALISLTSSGENAFDQCTDWAQPAMDKETENDDKELFLTGMFCSVQFRYGNPGRE